MMKIRFAICTMFLFYAARVASAQQAQLGTRWIDALTAYKPGRAVTVICPPNGAASKVWGSGPYTADSSVCTAAVHAGLITFAEGGVVTAVIGEGRKTFTASTRNGVTTLAYEDFPKTFSFAKEMDGGEINWNTTARGFPTSSTKPVTLICPPAGTTAALIYGTDTYSDDSSICVAAVHAGVIDATKGGRVVVAHEKGLSSYQGSARNAVTSLPYGAWAASFKFGNPSANSPTTAGPLAFRLSPITVIGMEQPTGYAFRLKQIVVVGEASIPVPYVFRLAPIVVEGLH